MLGVNDLARIPKGTLVMEVGAEKPVLLAAPTMENVNIGCLFVGVALQRLNVMIFRMAAARSDLLVLLKMSDVVRFQMTVRQIGHSHSRTGRRDGFRKYGALGIAPVP